MLGVAEADLQLEGGFVRVKGAPGMRKSLAELVDANDRRSGASRWRVVASRAARVHRAHRRRGTERVRIHLPPAASQRRTPPRTGAKPFGIGSRDDEGIDGPAKKFAGYRWFESISLQQTVCLSPAAAFKGREPGFPRVWAAGLATGSAETRRGFRYRVNRRQYLCRAIFQYRSAAGRGAGLNAR